MWGTRVKTVRHLSTFSGHAELWPLTKKVSLFEFHLLLMLLFTTQCFDFKPLSKQDNLRCVLYIESIIESECTFFLLLIRSFD